MASLRDLRERRKTVSSIQKITNAMKVVSVSKFRRAQKQMMSLRPYAEKSREIFRNLADGENGSETTDPYLMERRIEKVCYVLFLGDKGLCGGYNNNLIRYFDGLIAGQDHEYSVVVIGKWGNEIISRMNLPVIRRFSDVGDLPDTHTARQIIQYLTQLYKDKEADQVVMVYEKFVNVMTQKPSALTLLPVERTAQDPEEPQKMNAGDYQFEPEREEVLHSAIETYLDSTMFELLLEAKAGEHAARMTAMTAARDNTEQLMAELELNMNRVRQADITTEISEIVGGAAALKKWQQKKGHKLEDSE